MGITGIVMSTVINIGVIKIVICGVFFTKKPRKITKIEIKFWRWFVCGDELGCLVIYYYFYYLGERVPTIPLPPIMTCAPLNWCVYSDVGCIVMCLVVVVNGITVVGVVVVVLAVVAVCVQVLCLFFLFLERGGLCNTSLLHQSTVLIQHHPSPSYTGRYVVCGAGCIAVRVVVHVSECVFVVCL